MRQQKAIASTLQQFAPVDVGHQGSGPKALDSLKLVGVPEAARGLRPYLLHPGTPAVAGLGTIFDFLLHLL